MDVLKFTFMGILDGRVSHELYNTHSMMVRRCYDQDSGSYCNYGALGTEVQESWLGPVGFWEFVNDMGVRPQGMTLDRIDPYGDYTKDNCRWADKRTQANNTRDEGRGALKVKGVHWCERDKTLIVQTSLFKKRTVIGRFSLGEEELAGSLYMDVKTLKVFGVPDEEIYEKYVLAQRVGLGKTKKRRNKTSEYWGVSFRNSDGKWCASTDYYLGIFDTEELAHECVQNWLKLKSEEVCGPTSELRDKRLGVP